MNMLRWALLPFALIHAMILRIRHAMYNAGWLKSTKAILPTIVVGNLSFGGTGKTPHVLHLVDLLSDKFNIALLSRGYGRLLKGIMEVVPANTPLEVGDEVFLMKSKYPKLPIFIGEKRVDAIKEIQQNYPEVDLVILDDGLQHRNLIPNISILLEDVNHPLDQDYIAPVGRLRDIKSRWSKMDFVIKTKVSKSYKTLATLDDNMYTSEIVYDTLFKLSMPNAKLQRWPSEVLVVSAIANPKHLHQFVANKVKYMKVYAKPDHYKFKVSDIFNIAKQGIKDIICTEKDAVKLSLFKDEIKIAVIRIWVLPIQVQINHSADLKDKIVNRIKDAGH